MLNALDARLAQALPPGTLYAVGGRVRDEVRSDVERIETATKDLDYIVTGVPFDELRARLEKLGRVDLVGASFSVFKLTLDGTTVDVALPRRERSTGSAHRAFEVEGNPEIPLADDLARRDFRMNAMARALPGGDLVDPYGGEADIRARRIDILVDRAFEEDPLRMVRAAQFAARFEYTLTPRTLEAMREAAPLAGTLSGERIAEEFTKLLTRAVRPSIGLELLRETGVLAVLAPELVEGVGVAQNQWHAYDVWNHALATVDAAPRHDLVLRLAALLHDVGKPRTKEGTHFYRHEQVGAEMTRELLRRLRFSNEVVEATTHLVRSHMYAADPELSDPALRRSIRRIGVEYLERQFALRHADIAGSGLPKRDDANERFEARVREEVARKPAFCVADLAIGGEDVVGAMIRHGAAEPGFRGDPRVGEILRWLFEQVTEQPERNERQRLSKLLDEYFRGPTA
ncbi:MAG TPA: HDIG domain-containing metalloprotein [Candidatus Tyrphobacter sp.]